MINYGEKAGTLFSSFLKIGEEGKIAQYCSPVLAEIGKQDVKSVPFPREHLDALAGIFKLIGIDESEDKSSVVNEKVSDYDALTTFFKSDSGAAVLAYCEIMSVNDTYKYSDLFDTMQKNVENHLLNIAEKDPNHIMLNLVQCFEPSYEFKVLFEECLKGEIHKK